MVILTFDASAFKVLPMSQVVQVGVVQQSLQKQNSSLFSWRNDLKHVYIILQIQYSLINLTLSAHHQTEKLFLGEVCSAFLSL